MLKAESPSDVVIDWAKSIVENAYDRPWYSVKPPKLASEFYQPPCKCNTATKLLRYPCEDGAGYIYLGQCKRCQAIIWSFLECTGK